MLAADRKAQIVELVNREGSVELVHLTELLASSESTIRRDICELDQAGLVQRVHGGARAIKSRVMSTDIAAEERRSLNVQEKDAIGAFAASLVKAGDFVYIDAGTTTSQLVAHLTENRAHYMTNSIPIALDLLRRGFTTYLPAGEIKHSTEALIGEQAVASLQKIYFTLGFFGTNGVDIHSGFTTPDISEAAIKELALHNAKQAYVLCDSSKFDQVSMVSFAALDEAHIITDTAPAKLKEQLVADAIIEVGGSSQDTNMSKA